MKIESSTVALESQHASVERHTVRESLRFWTGNTRPDFEGRGRALGNPASLVSISDAANSAQAEETAAIKDSAEEAENDPKVQLILRMLEAMTGRKIRLVKAEDLQPDEKTQKNLDKAKEAGETARRQRTGGGLEYDFHESHYEAEITTFSAEGVIKTADGKEINFNLELAMSREYYEETNISVREGDAVRKDPLVINFNGTVAQLTEQKFAFDIDSDGTQDNISFVGPDSGFLALDRNANGKIDNGSELFGTESGNGFADLAQYDSDGNLWIDENDAVFADLRILRKDAGGNDSLSTLAHSGVGALYLGNVSTPFSVNTVNNTNLGQVRSSGVYLYENGGVGTLQQVDLAV